MKYHIKEHTFKILISFPSSICDFDKFFLLILLIATSQSVFWKEKKKCYFWKLFNKNNSMGEKSISLKMLFSKFMYSTEGGKVEKNHESDFMTYSVTCPADSH